MRWFLCRPGQVVGARYWWGTHMGVVTGFDRWGRALVTSNSMAAGRVVQEPISEFARGSAPFNMGFPSSLRRPEVVRRALSRLGEPYSLLTSNCEHMVNFALGRRPQSPQAQRGVVMTAVALIAILGRGDEGRGLSFA